MMATPHITRWWHNLFVHIALILSVGCVVYSGIVFAPFVYDDFEYILLNPAVENIDCITNTSNLKRLLLKEDVYKNIVLRPVAYLTFALNRHFDGYAVVGYHLFNIIIHLLNALLVYLITRLTLNFRVSSSGSDAGTSLNITNLMPLFIALLFVSHPLQTQSVTYITQRFSSLVAFFFLLSLALYIASGLSKTMLRRLLFYAAAFLAACTAMKTKENAFTLPMILLLYECIFFNNNWKLRIATLTPFLLTMLIIPATVMKLNTIFSPIAVVSVEKSMDLVNYNGISRWDYLFSQFGVIASYIRLLLLPINQSLVYDVPVQTSFFTFSVLMPFTLIIAILGSGIYLLHRSKNAEEPRRTLLCLTAFGVLWFFVTLSTESSIIPLDDFMVEQRVYLPSFGLILAVISITAVMFEKRHRAGFGMFVGLFSVLVILLSITAYTRNRLWMDPIALWTDSANKSPARPLAYQNLGAHFFGKRMFQESIAAFSTAQRLDPAKIEPTFNLATVYLALNRFDEAENEYLRAMKLHPNDQRISNSLARLYILQNKQSKALPLLQYLVKVNPYSPEVHIKLAELYEALGQRDLAVEEYMSVYRLTPDDPAIVHRINQLSKEKQ